MRPVNAITAPTSFLSHPYEEGELIDFTPEPAETELDRERDALRQRMEQAGDDVAELARLVDDYLILTELVETRGDFERSLRDFSGVESEVSLEEALRRTSGRLFGDAESAPREQITRLLEEVGILERSPHFPARVYSHISGETTTLPDDGTHFGYVLDGELEMRTANGRVYTLYPRTSFSYCGGAEISGEGRVQVMTRIGERGQDAVGVDLDTSVRLNYINGCQSALLAPPPRRGHACLNALFIPPNVNQTQHTHPSIRTGVVVEGSGVCRTPEGEIPLEAGNIFFLPPETRHSFHTPEQVVEGTRDALVVVVFHPDSDSGPTDEEHPMLNRTHYALTHRLLSYERTSQ